MTNSARVSTLHIDPIPHDDGDVEDDGDDGWEFWRLMMSLRICKNCYFMSWFKNLLNSREKAVSTSVCASGRGEGGGCGGLQLRAPQEARDQDQDVQHSLHAQVFPLCKVLVPSISRNFKPLVFVKLG